MINLFDSKKVFTSLRWTAGSTTDHLQPRIPEGLSNSVSWQVALCLTPWVVWILRPPSSLTSIWHKGLKKCLWSSVMRFSFHFTKADSFSHDRLEFLISTFFHFYEHLELWLRAWLLVALIRHLLILIMTSSGSLPVTSSWLSPIAMCKEIPTATPALNIKQSQSH